MLADLLRNRPLLLLSPHLDDAAFSAAALLDHPDVEVWTVFAGAPDAGVVTEWDRRCGFADGRSLIEARRAEDAEALAGLSLRQWDFLERAYVTAPQRAADLRELNEAVHAWLDAHPTGVLALPLGAGQRVPPAWYRRREVSPAMGEIPAADDESPTAPAPAPDGPKAGRRDLARRVLGLALSAARWALHQDYLRRRRKAGRTGMLANEDHLALRDAVVAGLGAREVDLVFYEEAPYAWDNPSPAAVDEVTPLTGRRPIPVETTVDPRAKARRNRHYATQLDVMDPTEGRLGDPDRLPSLERYWTVS